MTSRSIVYALYYDTVHSFCITILFIGPLSAGGSFNRSTTLPHRVERSSSATREGYYSDRQDAAREARERDRERGYLSDHALSR